MAANDAFEVGNSAVVTFGDDEIPDQQCKGVFFLSCAEVVSDRNQDLAKCGLAEDPLVECVVVRSEITGLGGDGLVVVAPQVFGEVAKHERHVMGELEVGCWDCLHVTTLSYGGEGRRHLVDLVGGRAGEPEHRAAALTTCFRRPRPKPVYLGPQSSRERLIGRRGEVERTGPGLGSCSRRVDRIVLDRRFGRRVQQSESGPHDVELELHVVGCPERSAQREGNPECSRWSYPFGLLANEADRRRRDAGAFDVVGEGADRARTQWSNGNQERDIDTIGGLPTFWLPPSLLFFKRAISLRNKFIHLN